MIPIRKGLFKTNKKSHTNIPFTKYDTAFLTDFPRDQTAPRTMGTGSR